MLADEITSKVGGCSPPRHDSPGSASLAWQYEQGHCCAKETNSVSLEIAASLMYMNQESTDNYFLTSLSEVFMYF
jgi:hypothetical protein